jgi:fructose-1,6-bisphosphatase/inositol monophosphatase family enzyme
MADPRNDPVLALFHDVADAVARHLGAVVDWGLSGTRSGQYVADVGADDVVVGPLVAAGFAVLSEESGWSGGRGRGAVVVVDPLDGSTNASRGLPWFATAMCLVDSDGPRVALVANQASGERFWAIRGGGAWTAARAGGPAQPDAATALHPSLARPLGETVIGISGRPGGDYGWWQFRALGASALDLCLVASGGLDGYVDMSTDAHGVWDYLAGALICREAGALVVDALGRELTVLDHDARRTPVAAATPELLDHLVAIRRG